MRYFAAVLSVFLSVILAQPIHARTGARNNPPQPHDGSTPWVRFPPSAAKALVDTLFIMGGPGSWDGSFETPGGQPDWHGWTHEDLNAPTVNHWHISTYWAENLGGHGPGNYAMNCVDETIPACDLPDTIGGYGHRWFDDLEWRHTVSDTSQPTTVRLTGFMNYDLTDVDWDFLEFFVQRGDYTDMLATWTGTGGAVDTLDFTTVLSPGEYFGPNGDEVRLFWRVWSDSAYDDLDCKTPGPGHGAARIDDIAVTFDDSLITFDDFEPGSPVNWIPPVNASIVGDFTNLRNDLGNIDPCLGNNTYQVNFVDDGVVVPGTGGTPCITWCYDPGGWIVNNTGGLLEDDQRLWFLENQIVSPPLAWLPGTDGAELSFDVYVDELLASDSAGVFYYWGVRSTASSDPADLESAPWKDRNFVHYGGPEYRRHVEPVTDLLVQDRQWVQIALGVNELGWVWNWNGPNGTPAPYFDNVAMKVWSPDGPEILVREADLFGDAFPEKGVLDPVNLAENWCRVDRSDVEYNSIPEALGDSLVIKVTPLRQGATVPNPPALHWVMECNPTFDSVRPAAPDPQGILRGMVDGAVVIGPPPGEVYLDRWSFDLPDSGWFFPGDRVRYYITASDDLGGDVRTSVWPPDTTAVLNFSLGSLFPKDAEIRALPTLTQPVAGQFTQPPILYCDSARDHDAAAVWTSALRELGLVQGVDFDAVTVFRANFGVGLAASATVNLLADYQTVVLSSGTRGNWTDDQNAASNDAKLILDWLATGGKHVLLAGDNLSGGLIGSQAGNDGFLLYSQLGISYYSRDISDLNGGMWDLQVSPTPGNGVLPDNISWQVGAGCPEVRKFDAITAAGNGQTSATLDPVGSSGGAYASVVTVDNQTLGNRTAVMPFDLERVSGMTLGSAKAGSVYSPRANLLSYFLAWFDSEYVSSVGDLPGLGQVAVTAHPNPFNPSTTITFDLPRAMEVSLDIYDLQGRLVRRLLDESPYVTGSHKQVWDGRDASGRATSSGVYFYRFTAGDQKRVGKLTLLK